METNLTKNPSLLAWLDEKIELLKPPRLCGLTAQKSRLTPLKQKLLKQAK